MKTSIKYFFLAVGLVYLLISGAQAQELIPFQIDGLTGFKGNSNEVLIPCQYKLAYRSEGGIWRVQKESKWGFIAPTGKVITPCIYDYAYDFEHGMAAVQLNKKWGYINRAGKLVIPCEYESGFDFYEGRVAVSKDGKKWGCLDSTGKEVLPCIYDKWMTFHYGIADVSYYHKFGFVDTTGKTIIPFKFDEIYMPFTGNSKRAIVKIAGRIYDLDMDGNMTMHCNDYFLMNRPSNYAPVCATDGRTYLNECIAIRLGATVVDSGNCPAASNQDQDTMKWPIKKGIYKVGGIDRVENPTDAKQIRYLKDGSSVMQETDGSFFRCFLWHDLAVCLPPSTPISTPKGDKFIKDIKEGDKIWTSDREGRKVVAPILQKNIVKVENHNVLSFVLDDGRTLVASPMHPDVNNIPLQNYQVGDKLDGATITKKELIPYHEKETQDILPAGETGYYWANGVLIGSTLKEAYGTSK